MAEVEFIGCPWCVLRVQGCRCASPCGEKVQILTEQEMRAAIHDFGGEEGWWHKSGEDVFNRLADWLTNRGFTHQEAANFLSEAYAAVQDEYGD